MSAGWWAAVAAATAAVFAADALEADPVDTVCELAHVDRSTTPSSWCTACHDGTSGQAVVYQMGSDDLGMSHPVDVDYGRVWMQDAERYVPEAMLPADVPLVDGKVACTSCHDGASPEPKHVIDPMRLCYACHRM